MLPGGVLVHNSCSANFDDIISVSTGRTEANNLLEQLAMESAKSNPTAGRIIMPELKDPRLAGYSKFSQHFSTSLGGIEIHYVGNLDSKFFFDFKFKE